MSTLTEIYGDPNIDDKIYRAMENEDASEVIMTALDLIKKSGKMASFLIPIKSANTSITLRNAGNRAYLANDWQAALEMYNRALLFAPAKSQEMVLGYSNRSALLVKIKRYAACLIDIQTCMDIGCTDDIVQKLKKRKLECKEFLWKENVKENNLKLFGNFFELNVERHPEIPCASKDVDIVMEDQMPKLVAARKIKVGTIVAIETPFVAQIVKERYASSCYYCHKISLNLIPCDGCVYVMFCGEECKEQCMREYHSKECQIMHVLHTVVVPNAPMLAFKAALKMRQMSKSWEEFIEASQNIGQDKMKSASVRDIFDGNSKFSLLSFDDSKMNTFLGPIYNICSNYAIIMHHLEIISYFPSSANEKDAAMRAFARIMMKLYLSFPTSLLLNQTVEHITTDVIGKTVQNNHYLLAFANRLAHSCEANIMPLPLHNKVALVAQRPIKKGAELSISYVGHWFDISFMRKRDRAKFLYHRTHQVCKCRVCSETWKVENVEKDKLSVAQTRCYLRWKSSYNQTLSLGPQYTEAAFRTVCDALAAVDATGNTEERLELFTQFRRLLNMYQYVATKNEEPGIFGVV